MTNGKCGINNEAHQNGDSIGDSFFQLPFNFVFNLDAMMVAAKSLKISSNFPHVQSLNPVFVLHSS